MPALETGSTAENEESGEPVRLLKGHDTEVRHVQCLTLATHTKSENSSGLRLCMEPCSPRRADFGVSALFSTNDPYIQFMQVKRRYCSSMESVASSQDQRPE
jgi:hypothetical protein